MTKLDSTPHTTDFAKPKEGILRDDKLTPTPHLMDYAMRWIEQITLAKQASERLRDGTVAFCGYYSLPCEAHFTSLLSVLHHSCERGLSVFISRRYAQEYLCEVHRPAMKINAEQGDEQEDAPFCLI